MKTRSQRAASPPRLSLELLTPGPAVNPDGFITERTRRALSFPPRPLTLCNSALLPSRAAKPHPGAAAPLRALRGPGVRGVDGDRGAASQPGAGGGGEPASEARGGAAGRADNPGSYRTPRGASGCTLGPGNGRHSTRKRSRVPEGKRDAGGRTPAPARHRPIEGRAGQGKGEEGTRRSLKGLRAFLRLGTLAPSPYFFLREPAPLSSPRFLLRELAPPPPQPALSPHGAAPSGSGARSRRVPA